MAANKFASMIHRNTNKMTLLLIYALLEWILILLLLLNSLFFHLIIKFAHFFGLQPPCLCCNRILDPPKNHRGDLLCQPHSGEFSKLGYKLAESLSMCGYCSSSTPEFKEFSKILSFFGVIRDDEEKVGGKDEVSLKCCGCCGARLDNNTIYILLNTSSCHVFKHDWISGCDSDDKTSDFSADSKVFEGEFYQSTVRLAEAFDFLINEEPKCRMLESMEVEEDENVRDLGAAAAREMHLDVNTGPLQVKEQIVGSQCESVQDREDTVNNESSLELDLNEIDKDKARVTVESLRIALREERKHLQVLYADLEEERNASAVAADQAMAMINRLQEEKAAIQMEALQYERMMEEQCEYDQEALQMMNGLMVERETEKEELVKELELYRKMILHYEIKEKMKQWESEGLAIHLNHESKECDGTIINSDRSLADFEEERLSILAELKVLEEKLIMLLDDEKEQQFEGVGDFNEENVNVHLNVEEYGFDAICYNFYAPKIEMQSKKLGIEEEVDHLYQRLEALEAEEEFIKRCFRSLEKGEEGMELLEEILRHLHDLRNIELHVRNSRDACSSTSESTVVGS